MASNQSFPYRRWTPARVRFVSSPLHCLYELDWQMQPSWWVCHDRKLKSQLPAMRWWFDSAFTEAGLQHTLNMFAAAYDIAGIKIWSKLHDSRNPNRCLLQLNGVTQKHIYKFKYLEVAFTSDGRQDKELDIQIDKAIAIMRTLHYSVIVRLVLSKKSRALNFQNSLCPISPALSVWSSKFDNDWKSESQVQASNIRYLQKIKGVTLLTRCTSLEVWKSLQTLTSPN